MASKKETLIAEENAKRKALSKVRVFWLTLGLDALLIIYIIMQISILANK